MDNATLQASRQMIVDWRTPLNERKNSLDTSVAQLKEKADREDERLKEDDKEFKEDVVSLIRDEGASIRKAFVLHSACRHRLPAHFDILFGMVPSNEKAVAINGIDFAGCTPLFTAAQSVPDQVADADEHYEFVEKLLELGADKNQTDFKGMSALGMYRSVARSRDELSDALTIRSGVSQSEHGWKAKYEKMEDMLMPTEGETEADRDAKKTSETLIDADDEEDG